MIDRVTNIGFVHISMYTLQISNPIMGLGSRQLCPHLVDIDHSLTTNRVLPKQKSARPPGAYPMLGKAIYSIIKRKIKNEP